MPGRGGYLAAVPQVLLPLSHLPSSHRHSSIVKSKHFRCHLFDFRHGLLTPPGPPGPESMESKAGASCRHPSESPPSVPAGVDMFVAPAPREAGRETSPCHLSPLPQTSPRLFPELRHWPWLTDRLPGGSPIYKREHTNPKSAKTVQPSP